MIPKQYRALVAIFVAVLFACFTGAQFNAPCDTEDSINCTWYGDIQGNRKGDTVTRIGWDNDNPWFTLSR